MLDSVIDLKVAFMEMPVVVLLDRISIHLQDVEKLIYLMSLYHEIRLQSYVSSLSYDSFHEWTESESVVWRTIARTGMCKDDVDVSNLARQFSIQYESLVRPPALSRLHREVFSSLVSGISPLAIYRNRAAYAKYALAFDFENSIVGNQLYVAESERILVEVRLEVVVSSKGTDNHVVLDEQVVVHRQIPALFVEQAEAHAEVAYLYDMRVMYVESLDILVNKAEISVYVS